MIKRIFIAIFIIFVIAFIAVWLLGGGLQNIKAAIGHYRNPLQYHSVLEYFFQIGSTSGETFKIPGSPSAYPTLSIPQSTSDASTTNGPTTIYVSGSTGGDGVQ